MALLRESLMRMKALAAALECDWRLSTNIAISIMSFSERLQVHNDSSQQRNWPHACIHSGSLIGERGMGMRF